MSCLFFIIIFFFYLFSPVGRLIQHFLIKLVTSLITSLTTAPQYRQKSHLLPAFVLLH